MGGWIRGGQDQRMGRRGTGDETGGCCERVDWAAGRRSKFFAIFE